MSPSNMHGKEAHCLYNYFIIKEQKRKQIIVFLTTDTFMDSIGYVLQAYVSVRDFLEFSNFLAFTL